MRIAHALGVPEREQSRQYALLAPLQTEPPETFYEVEDSSSRYGVLMAEMQRLRGGVYFRDGAIESSQLSPDGRHILPVDRQSWHLLVLDSGGRVLGCMRYRHHESTATVHQAGVFDSALARDSFWGAKLSQAVHYEAEAATREGIGFGEAGGWALAEELRCSLEALRMVLATYCLARLLGNARVVSTATLRNGSAQILRRIGGRSLMVDGAEMPGYFDPHYKCEMQILNFDSRSPNPRYQQWVEQLAAELRGSPVVCGGRASAAKWGKRIADTSKLVVGQLPAFEGIW